MALRCPEADDGGEGADEAEAVANVDRRREKIPAAPKLRARESRTGHRERSLARGERFGRGWRTSCSMQQSLSRQASFSLS